MDNFHNMLLCMNNNFKKWKNSPRIYVILIILVIFHFYGFDGYRKISEFLEVPISPWVFPFFLLHPLMMFTFGAIPMLLYGEAPFTDHQSPFIVIRAGRQNWIIGQILYIILSSFIYTAISILISILSLVPQVRFDSEWGQVIYTMGQNADVANLAGVNIMMPGTQLINKFTSTEAMMYSFLLYWLATTFLGLIILSFNVCIKKGTGMIVAGVFTCMCYFSAIFGNIGFGKIIMYFSPVSWGNIYNISKYDGDGLPSFTYALTILISSILIMSMISVIAFCKKDLDFEKGEY